MAYYHKTPSSICYKIWDFNPKASTPTPQLQTQLWAPMQLLSFIRSSILIFSRNSKKAFMLNFLKPLKPIQVYWTHNHQTANYSTFWTFNYSNHSLCQVRSNTLNTNFHFCFLLLPFLKLLG